MIFRKMKGDLRCEQSDDDNLGVGGNGLPSVLVSQLRARLSGGRRFDSHRSDRAMAEMCVDDREKAIEGSRAGAGETSNR